MTVDKAQTEFSFQPLIAAAQKNAYPELLTLWRVIETLAEGVIIADVNGKFILFNPVAERILGVGEQAVASSEWTQVYGCFYPDQKTPFPSDELPLARAIRGEVVRNVILFIKNRMRPEGVYIDISATPLYDGEDQVVGGIVIFHDITEKIIAEKLSQETERRIEAQFRGFPMPTYVWQYLNDTFILTDCNDAADALSHGKVKNYIGQEFVKIFKDSAQIRGDLTRAFAEKSIITRDMPYMMITTGEQKHVIFTYVYIPDDMVLMHLHDVTELKQTEKELRKLSSAVEQTADSILITNREEIIEYVNQGFVDTTGYSREDAVGQTPRLLNSGKHDKEYFTDYLQTIRNGQSFRGTIINRKKNGELYWSHQTITPMRNEEGEISHYVSVLKDITELRKRQEQEFNLRVAQEVQKNLYKNSASLPGFDLAGATYSADETNGDYFDFIPLADGHLGLVIGDVSGHGIGAALIMASARAYLRAFAKTESDPGRLLTLLNRELAADLREHKFITMILARINPQRRVLDYAGAGHEPAYLLDADGQVKETLASQGIPMGILKEVVYSKSGEIELQAGDVALFLTDGISEACTEDGPRFGASHAIECVAKHQGLGSQEIITALYQEVRAFICDQPHQDDITSIIMQVGERGDV